MSRIELRWLCTFTNLCSLAPKIQQLLGSHSSATNRNLVGEPNEVNGSFTTGISQADYHPCSYFCCFLIKLTRTVKQHPPCHRQLKLSRLYYIQCNWSPLNVSIGVIQRAQPALYKGEDKELLFLKWAFWSWVVGLREILPAVLFRHCFN